jgi:hypothetical protein
MLHLLKRHPLPVRAHFRHSLVLTYALPREVLEPLLPPGLELDCYEDFGFVAIALVQTENLRPAFLPALLGQNFFLSGYRIFTRYTTQQGRHLRGLRILRSDTDRRLMAAFGNLLTHYHYRLARVTVSQSPQSLEIEVRTPNAEADLQVRADLSLLSSPASEPAPLPADSPFPDLKTALHFAGPLPYTFDYEKQTHSLILIKGVRKKWSPQPVPVDVKTVTFFEQDAFRGTAPMLANAFYVSDIPYRWLRGRRETLPPPMASS